MLPYHEFRQQFLHLIGVINAYGNNPLKLVVLDSPANPMHSVSFNHRLERLFDMAAKKRAAKQQKYQSVEFINFKLDKKQKDAFNKWFAESGETFVKGVYETLQDEHKIGLSWDSEKDCFIASMTGKEDSLNKGRCITMRSDDWTKALAALAFTHTVIFNGEVWDVEEESDLV